MKNFVGAFCVKTMKWEDDSGKYKSEEWDVGAKFATELKYL